MSETMVLDTTGEAESAEKGDEGGNPALPKRDAVKLFRKGVGTVLMLAVAAAAVLAGMALFSGRWMATPVLSGSMRPGFSVGGLVVAERVPVKSLADREVIIFQRPNEPSEQMVHRIIQITPGKSGQLEIKTQGDANNAPDPWNLTIRQPYIYRVRYSVPLVGYGVVAFQNHRGYLLVGAGVVALLVGGSVLLEKKRDEPKVRG